MEVFAPQQSRKAFDDEKRWGSSTFMGHVAHLMYGVTQSGENSDPRSNRKHRNGERGLQWPTTAPPMPATFVSAVLQNIYAIVKRLPAMISAATSSTDSLEKAVAGILQWRRLCLPKNLEGEKHGQNM